MTTWLEYRQEYLDELLRLEGRGLNAAEAREGPSCADCKAQEGTYRCVECFGRELVCEGCCISRHRRLPLHRIEVNFKLTVLARTNLDACCSIGKGRISSRRHCGTSGFEFNSVINLATFAQAGNPAHLSSSTPTASTRSTFSSVAVGPMSNIASNFSARPGIRLRLLSRRPVQRLR